MLVSVGGRTTSTGGGGSGGNVGLVAGPFRPRALLAALTGPESPMALVTAAIGRRMSRATLRRMP